VPWRDGHRNDSLLIGAVCDIVPDELVAVLPAGQTLMIRANALGKLSERRWDRLLSRGERRRDENQREPAGDFSASHGNLRK
jgi:hypothetical protein